MPYIIKNGLTYTGNLMPITQAQYEALSEAEKNNGIAYFIVDSDAVLDASDVGLGEGNVEDLAGSVAVIETSPATAIHAVGDFILWNGQLYTVTSAIAVGETLTVGSNITATSAGSELSSLKAGLTVETLTASPIASGVTITFQSMKCWGNVLQFSIIITASQQISQYGNIVSLGGKKALAGWCHVIYTAGFVPTEYTVYGDENNLYIRSARTLPAGSYRLIGMILCTD